MGRRQVDHILAHAGGNVKTGGLRFSARQDILLMTMDQEKPNPTSTHGHPTRLVVLGLHELLVVQRDPDDVEGGRG